MCPGGGGSVSLFTRGGGGGCSSTSTPAPPLRPSAAGRRICSGAYAWDARSARGGGGGGGKAPFGAGSTVAGSTGGAAPGTPRSVSAEVMGFLTSTAAEAADAPPSFEDEGAPPDTGDEGLAPRCCFPSAREDSTARFDGSGHAPQQDARGTHTACTPQHDPVART